VWVLAGMGGVGKSTVALADVNRSRLLTAPAHSELLAISDVAVCLQRASEKLDFRLPADWPAWRQLVPHVAAVLDWLDARLDLGTLVTLLDVGDATARALLRSGNPAAADKLVRSCMAAAGRLGPNHPANLTARCSLATMVREQGRYREAEQLHLRVLTAQRRLLGDDDPATLRTCHNLAWGMAGQGRYAESEWLHRQVLPDRERVLGTGHPDTLDTRCKLAQVIAKQGSYGEAEELYRRLITDQSRALGGDHPDATETRHGLATVIATQGRHHEAERLYQQVLADRQRLLGGDHPDTLRARQAVGRISSPDVTGQDR
jgi:tetratricopeptide (TPR) repeat protein